MSGLAKKSRGHTLVELITVILLMGIIIATTSSFVGVSIEGYAQTKSRVALSDLSAPFLLNITRDIQSALPNSIRVKSGGKSIELLHVVAAGRYRASPPAAAGGILTFDGTVSSFNILAPYTQPAPYPSFLPLAASGPYRVVIYNMGDYQYNAGTLDYDQPLAGVNVYNPDAFSTSDNFIPVGAHVITPASTTVTLGASLTEINETQVMLSSPHQFSLQSPQQRVFIVDTPISYSCDLSTGTITKYYRYDLSTVQPSVAVDYTSGQNALALDQVTACIFSYDAGTAHRSGVVTIELSVGDGIGNTLHFMKQVQVQNAA